MGAKVVSFINLKGGVGKTTLVTAISEFLVFQYKKRVLLIDVDHQTNLTYSMLSKEKVQKIPESKTVAGLFRSGLQGEKFDILGNIVKEGVSNIGYPEKGPFHILPSHPALIELDSDILGYALQGERIKCESPELILKNFIDKVIDGYDFILIDCPPHLGLTTQNAMAASDYFVVPVVPEYLSLQGLSMIHRRAEALKRKYENIKIDFLGVIINKLDIRRKDLRYIAEILYYPEEIIRKLLRGEKVESPFIRDEKYARLYLSERLDESGNIINFKPFKWWIPDAKPLYTITDYQYPLRIAIPFGSFNFLMKYPPSWILKQRILKYENSILMRKDEEYSIFQRLNDLTKEFIEKTSK